MMINKNDLVGEWSLSEFEIVDNKNNKKKWRNGTHGLLIYTPGGYVSVSINSEVEDDHESPINRFNSILFYSGSYEILGGNKIVHHVTNASDLNRVGKDMLRDAILNGDTLELIGKGDFGTARIVWTRILS